MSSEPDGNGDRIEAAERLMRLRAGSAGGLAAVQSELLRERALSYSRAVERVDGAYTALADAERALDDARADVRATFLARCDEARERALYLRWELLVQREACGMVDSEAFEQTWPVPKRRR